MPKIIKNNIVYGPSSLMVELTQAEYNALSSAQKNNGTIYLITDSEPDAFNLNSMDDVSISSPTNNQVLSYSNGEWVNTGLNSLMPTTISVTKGSTMPSDFPTPNVSRRGNVCVINFAMQIPAGTYASTDVLWNVSPRPVTNNRCIVAFSGDPNRFINLNILSDGTIKFNGNKTTTDVSWLIGQAVYLTDGVTS